MAKRSNNERWHSAVWEAMTPAQRDEFRAVAADPRTTIEAAVAWCVERGLAASQSGVYRLLQRLAVEAARDRIRDSLAAARKIGRTVADSGGVAEPQAAAVALYTQLVFDFLLSAPRIGVDDLTKIANLGKGLAAVQAAEIVRYKAEVERRAREAAETVARIGRENKLDAAAIDAIRKAVFGVARAS